MLVIQKNPYKHYVYTGSLMNYLLLIISDYFTSSKTTLTDYQCVSTGCCTHVAKTEITIDNQHVTNIIAKVQISPRITKRKHRKKHKLDDFSWFGLPFSSLPILYFCQCCHFFNPAHSPLYPSDKQREYSPNRYSTHF